MALVKKLVDLSLASFASSLAERTPTPGGGSLAAFMVAAGSATASMAFRFTSGQKYSAVEEIMAHRARALDELREHALDLVDRDAIAYNAVSAGLAVILCLRRPPPVVPRRIPHRNPLVPASAGRARRARPA